MLYFHRISFILPTADTSAPKPTEKVAGYLAPQPTVNPLVGWENAPTTVPDTSKVAPIRNYTYPKVHDQGTTHFLANQEIANETIYPEVSVPVEGSPSYNLYNKTENFVEHVLPVAQSITSGSQISVYDSSTPQEAVQVQTATLEPTAEPVVVMNANELPVVPVEEMEVLEIKETPDWVVQIPQQAEPVENNGVENIRISFIDKKQPISGVNEISIHPPAEGNTENIKISFIGNQTSAEGNSITLQPNEAAHEHQKIKISFEKEKEEKIVPAGVPLVTHGTENVAPAGVPLVAHETESAAATGIPLVVHEAKNIATTRVPMVVHETEGPVVVEGPVAVETVPKASAHILATPAPPMPTGPGVVNPFEGGVVDSIIRNATMMAPVYPHQNITVDFLHNAATAGPAVQQPQVTLQQQRK